jgi:hypothetical protein
MPQQRPGERPRARRRLNEHCEADWRHFDETDDLDERQAEIAKALDGLSGRALAGHSCA